MKQLLIVCLICLCFPLSRALAQGLRQAQGDPKFESEVRGIVSDSTNHPIGAAKIRIVQYPQMGAFTDDNGFYRLKVPSGRVFSLQFSYFGRTKVVDNIGPMQPMQRMRLDVRISTVQLDTTVVKAEKQPRTLMEKIDPRHFEQMVDFGGSFESRLKILPSVSSNNELSSQYSVRGGNFDENLVYINDIEIFRPQLIRSGQQEGLSIIQSDLVKDIYFSPGGFEAQYGDKLSSVLDIKYKEPDSFRMKASASLLGAGLSLEGSSGNHRFRYLGGIRYRTTTYLLKTLDVKGTYKPSFTDAQTYLSYDVNDKLTLNAFSYFGDDYYLSQPVSQSTVFGTVSAALRLNVGMGGQQIFQFRNFVNALTATLKQSHNTTYKLIASVSTDDEHENFDILGGYALQQLETDAGSDKFGDAKYTLGSGGYLDHGRNSLFTTIYNTELKGYHKNGGQIDLQWGLKFQHEHIEDKLSEYQYVDSADYALPRYSQPDTMQHIPFNIYESIYSRNTQDWNRYMAYVQNSFLISRDYNSFVTVGVRGNFWDFNRQFLLSPRAQFAFEPNARYNRRRVKEGSDSLKLPLRLRLAAGVYDQPPFYREMRGLYGNINPEIRAQRSYQYTGGTDISLKLWDRPFRWSTDVYYKDLRDIIPYEVDNVRIRYFGTNEAQGYAAGAETQLGGEFVKDNPSYFSAAVMQTREKLIDSGGYYPRPTDQRVRLSFYFQDYLPRFPSYKIHLTLVFGSGLPVSLPGHKGYSDDLRTPPYKRVDVGFSRMLFERGRHIAPPRYLRGVRSIWVSLEVFNLFNINNTVSYLWVKDVSGDQWAVPNYLTSRRLNLHLEMKF